MRLFALLVLVGLSAAALGSNESSLEKAQLDYLVARWCKPFANLTSEYPKYDRLVSEFFPEKCRNQVRAAQLLISFWGLDNTWVPFLVYAKLAHFSQTVIAEENFTVSTPFLQAHCVNMFTYRLFFDAYTFFAALTSPFVAKSDAVFGYLQAFVAVVFTPVVVLTTALSALVLREIGREREALAIPYMRLELALQTFAFFTFAYFLMLSSWMPAAPFCFISGRAAYNWQVVGFAFQFWAVNPIWLMLAIVKSAIIIDRVIALYSPLWYHEYVTRERIKRFMFYLFGGTLFVIVVATTVFFVNAFGVPGTHLYNVTRLTDDVGVQVTLFYGGLIGANGFLQLACALLLARKLLKKHFACRVAPGSHDQKLREERAKWMRKLTVMVLSTCVFNQLSYCTVILYIVVFECSHGCAGLLPEGFRADFIVLGTGIIVDVNSTACFLTQCALSRTYARAARKVILDPLRSCFRYFMGLSIPIFRRRRDAEFSSGIPLHDMQMHIDELSKR